MSECIYRCYICVLMVRLVYCMSSGFHIEGAFPGLVGYFKIGSGQLKYGQFSQLIINR